MNRLANKVAIVTGGAVGIGRAGVERLAQEGASVAILDVNDSAGQALAAGFQDRGQRVAFWHVDTASEAQVKSAIGDTVKRFG
ncbi:MAG: SDR family NAD(P)-dependent oxidoreductase [Pseudomonadota bacterium]